MEVSQWYMNMGDWLEGGPVCENCGQYCQESWLGNLLIVLGCEGLQKPHTPILLGLCCQRKITSSYYEY